LHLNTFSDTPHRVGRTPQDEGSVRHRDLYMTTHNTHKRQTSVTQARSAGSSGQHASRGDA
jgi:hypothetical protein